MTDGARDASLVGFANLWRMLNQGTPLPALVARYQLRLANHPHDAAALLDLATLLMFLLNAEQRKLASQLQDEAIALQRVYPLPPGKTPVALRLLVIMAAMELLDLTANTPIDCLLLDSDIAITLLYVADGETLPATLPEHDLIFVAVGESDRSTRLLQQLQQLPSRSTRPIINPAPAIAQLGRVAVAERLQQRAGIAMPLTHRVSRAAVHAVAQGTQDLANLLPDGRFPIIIRPIDSHGGNQLQRLEQPHDLASYLAGAADAEFYLSPFIDYRNNDGQYRKYRIVLIDGQPYACHMAISSHWMVHYLNANMDASAAKRAEEAAFMADFDHAFARRHAAALAEIQQQIGLDYVGIDCAELADGRLLVFEIDSAMVVHANDDPLLYPYKLAPMQRLFAAFRQMLLQRAGVSRA